MLNRNLLQHGSKKLNYKTLLQELENLKKIKKNTSVTFIK